LDAEYADAGKEHRTLILYGNYLFARLADTWIRPYSFFLMNR
jgi:hypothetical protein